MAVVRGRDPQSQCVVRSPWLRRGLRVELHTGCRVVPTSVGVTKLAFALIAARGAMDSSLGARLRLQREQRQVALSDIAAETKIKLSFLEGLERDDVSGWPAGIFRRAYLRAYARAIGLEPEVIVREFLELHPDSVEVLPAGTRVWPNLDTESVRTQPAAGRRGAVTATLGVTPSFLQHAHRTPARARGPAEGRDAPAEGESVRREPDVSARDGTGHPVEGEGAPCGPGSGLPSSRDDGLADPEPVRPEPHVSADRDPPPEDAGERSEISLSAAAQVCTRLGRVLDVHEVTLVLEDTASILGAVGLVVWSWDSRTSALRPWFAHGYSEAVLAHFSTIPTNAENATAAAFRTAEASVLNGGENRTGAVVVPLMASGGCVGVLALEFRHGAEQHQSVHAFAAIVAAQLVTLLFGAAPLAEAVGTERQGYG